MNGVATLRQLLCANAGVLALVPEARIVTGELPENTPLPSILITSEETSYPHKSLTPAATIMVRERIQVAALAKNYPEAKAVIQAAVRAAGSAMPIVTGIADVVVRVIDGSPDQKTADSKIRVQAQDFSVTYNAPR